MTIIFHFLALAVILILGADLSYLDVRGLQTLDLPGRQFANLIPFISILVYFIINHYLSKTRILNFRWIGCVYFALLVALVPSVIMDHYTQKFIVPRRLSFVEVDELAALSKSRYMNYSSSSDGDCIVLRKDMMTPALNVFIQNIKNHRAEPGATANKHACHESCSEQHASRQACLSLSLNVGQIVIRK